MANLTIRMEHSEKQRLNAWAASQGKSVTDYLKELVAADMAAGTPESRAKAWLRENQGAIAEEAQSIAQRGVPGAHLAMSYPKFDEQV